jgi:hypothetical protein
VQDRTRWLLIAVAALSVGEMAGRSAEPILTLAYLRTDTAPSYAPSPGPARATVFLQAPSVPSTNAPARLSLDTNGVPVQTVTALSLSTGEQPSRDMLKAGPRTDEEAERRGLWASARFQAGVGQIFHDRPAVIYGRNGTRWEEPGCGYLKVSIRF